MNNKSSRGRPTVDLERLDRIYERWASNHPGTRDLTGEYPGLAAEIRSLREEVERLRGQEYLGTDEFACEAEPSTESFERTIMRLRTERDLWRAEAQAAARVIDKEVVDWRYHKGNCELFQDRELGSCSCGKESFDTYEAARQACKEAGLE